MFLFNYYHGEFHKKLNFIIYKKVTYSRQIYAVKCTDLKMLVKFNIVDTNGKVVFKPAITSIKYNDTIIDFFEIEKN